MIVEPPKPSPWETSIISTPASSNPRATLLTCAAVYWWLNAWLPSRKELSRIWIKVFSFMSAPLLLFFVYDTFRSGQFLLFTGNPLLGFAFPSRSPSLPLVTARLPPSFSAEQKYLHRYDQRHQCENHENRQGRCSRVIWRVP